ncbi:MAG: hypothetical protein QE271_13325 [Bacteriovoracaceae bacterium]|nr:hypothetical protein [Bacteriovoracaceae bacterium]
MKQFIKELYSKYYQWKYSASCGSESPQAEYYDACWTNLPSTPDQVRIEDYLKKELRGHEKILHIGIGNSLFAKSFRLIAPSVEIHGITCDQLEIEHAQKNGIVYKTVFETNKYDPHALKKLYGYGNFDIIIDNNLSSFSCCNQHFFLLLKTYAQLLAPNGWIITDRVGLAYRREEKGLSLNYSELKRIGKALGLNVCWKTDYLIAVENL